MLLVHSVLKPFLITLSRIALVVKSHTRKSPVQIVPWKQAKTFDVTALRILFYILLHSTAPKISNISFKTFFDEKKSWGWFCEKETRRALFYQVKKGRLRLDHHGEYRWSKGMLAPALLPHTPQTSWVRWFKPCLWTVYFLLRSSDCMTEFGMVLRKRDKTHFIKVRQVGWRFV